MNNLFCVVGGTGSGKDVLMMRYLTWCYSKRKRKVISNCYINGIDHIELNNNQLYEKILNKEHEFFRDSYLYITEAHYLFESRAAISNVNRVLSQFLTQINKLNCKILFNHQLLNQVDVRLRDFVNEIIITEKYVIRDGELVKPSFLDDRKLTDQIYIKMIINFQDYVGRDHFELLGWFIPNEDDFVVFNTEEIITFDREKYLIK